MLNGIDHSPVQKDLSKILEVCRSYFKDYEFIHCGLNDYIAEFKKKQPELAQRTGILLSRDINKATLHGTWSGRIDIKIVNAFASSYLENLAEPLTAIISLYGGPANKEELRIAWRLLLQNHAHDSICGCVTDHVNIDVIQRFKHVQEIAEMIAYNSLYMLSGKNSRAQKPALYVTVA